MAMLKTSTTVTAGKNKYGPLPCRQASKEARVQCTSKGQSESPYKAVVLGTDYLAQPSKFIITVKAQQMTLGCLVPRSQGPPSLQDRISYSPQSSDLLT